jgi:hypothetical protein
MYFIKVKGEVVEKYPYTMQDLRNENPSTQYDSRYSISEWYSMTENGISSQSKVFKVEILPIPIHDLELYYPKIKSIPTFENNKWVLGWDLIEIVS